ncbi:MAG: class I SAM-dependent methyltransferase [Calditrichota bacterium]
MSDITKQIADLFDSVAHQYDGNAFFQKSAEKLVNYLPPDLEGRVLDICCGTGAISIILAKHFPHLSVHGIDISEVMLKIAREKCNQLKIYNAYFTKLDVNNALAMQGFYDSITAGYALFFLPELPATLQKLTGKLKPGGILAFSTFTANAFQPYLTHFRNLLEEYDVHFPQIPHKLQTETEINNICQAAGVATPIIVSEEIRYPIESEDWWQLLNSAGYKAILSQISKDHISEFKTRHLKTIKEYSVNNKIMLNADSLLSFVLHPY